MTGFEHNQLDEAWQNALSSHHDVLLLNTDAPRHCQERIANACDQGVLTIKGMKVRRPADAIALLNASVLRRAPLHRTVTTIVNQYQIQRICSSCAAPAQLDEKAQQWLQHLRTPVTENVVGWLNDGNTDQFMSGEGCENCGETGLGEILPVYDILHRDKQNHLFPDAKQSVSLQRQLMSLARSGQIRLQDVIRVLELAA